MYSDKAVAEFVPDNIIVDTEHRQHVEKELQALGMYPDRVEEHAALGLTLLGGVQNLQRSASELRPALQSLIDEAEARHGTPGTFSDLDVALTVLRERLAGRGLSAELGKDRHAFTTVTIDGCPGGQHCPVGDPRVMSTPKLAHSGAEPLDGGTPLGRASVTVDALDGAPALGAGVTVGILDNQADPCAEAASTVRLPWQGHGMFVESLVRRHAREAQVVRTVVRRGDSGRTRLWTTAAAIAELADSGIDVLHLALTCRTLDGEPPLALTRALGALGPRVLVVAAAGNHGGSTPGVPIWPAALEYVVAVGATDAPFSPMEPWVDYTADGVDQIGTFYSQAVYLPTQLPSTVASEEHNGWLAPDAERITAHGAPEPTIFTGSAVWSGTSLAAANVAGAVAAELSARGGSAREALDRLAATGDVVRPLRHDGDDQQ